MPLTTSVAIPPDGIGDCIMSSHLDPATGEYALTIDHADPVILISAQLLEQVCEGYELAGVRRCMHFRPADGPARDPFIGGTIRIEGTNQAVVYRITGRRDEHNYIGRWPD